MMYDSMDIGEIDTITTNENLIDIRDKYEYVLSHIKGAKNIPYTYLMMMPDNYLTKDRKYYFYCDCGTKSRKVCNYLTELGYQAVDLIGGFEHYQEKKNLLIDKRVDD